MKKALIFVSLAIVLSLASMGIKWEYCMDGNGYGFPAAIIHPHEDSFLFYRLEPDKDDGTTVDFDNVMKDILFWSFVTNIAYFSGSRFLRKRQARKVLDK